MKSKTPLIISIVLIIAIIACTVGASLAWFSSQFVGTQSLDFAVFSESIVTMDLGDGFDIDFLPARAYKGAVASGLEVDNIFADPFFYSEDGTQFFNATSEQLQARLALRRYTAGATTEADRYPLAETEFLVSAQTDPADKALVYYYNGKVYTPATDEQIEAGLCVYTQIGEGDDMRFDHATYEELTGDYIIQKAQIGVVELSFAYYGSAEESSMMKLACGVYSLWPNAPEDVDVFESSSGESEPAESGEGEGGIDRSLWFKDISDEVSYMVCVSGYMGFTPDDNLRITSMPDTNVCIASDGGEYVVLNAENAGEYGATSVYGAFMRYINESNLYLFTCNLDHDSLLGYFGINDYTKAVCTITGSISGAELSITSFNFDPSWDDNNYGFTSEDLEATGTFHEAVTTAVQRAFTLRKSVDFTYNAIGYAVQFDEYNPTSFHIYQTTKGIGKMNMSTTMELSFYVFLWYNQVDELLSPNVTFGDIGLAITLDTQQ